MIKYTDSQVVFREFPDEVTLALNLSLCPNNCKNCHSPYLADDIGKELVFGEIDRLVRKNNGITCIGFMGGDNDTETLLKLVRHVKSTTDLKCGWYSGKDVPDPDMLASGLLDYVKTGHYDEEFGPLDSRTTNQRMFKLSNGVYTDITHLFWK